MCEYKTSYVKINKMRLSVGSWRIEENEKGESELILKDIYFKNKKDVIEFTKKIFEVM